MSNLATTDGDAPSPIDEIAQEFLGEHRRGLEPDVDEYCRRYPELADELRPILSVTITLEMVRPKMEAHNDSRGAKLPWERLGDFRLIREAGRGGMGVVYEAVQESLSRRVAVKTLSSAIAHSRTQLERFQREARAVASLHHTNIVSVFAVGEDHGVQFYAMPFIHGTGLDQVINELRTLTRQPKSNGRSSHKATLINAGATDTATLPEATPDSPTSASAHSLGSLRDWSSAYEAAQQNDSQTTRISNTANLSNENRGYWYRVARVGLQVADAMAYAHGQGVLHRDIKPSNLLLDHDGTIWVTDFGLAKVAESDDLTRTGEMVGTLRYLAPERLKGVHDIRGDIYGLGLTLYELLTLRKPFPSGHKAEMTRQILDTELDRPRQVDAHIPLDLETIVLRAIAKDPDDRYQTPDALFEDLRLFLDDRPINSRRVGVLERSWRWCRRNPAVASLTACVATLVIATITILLMSNAEIRRESAQKVQALNAKTDAMHQLETANRQQRASEQLAEKRYYAAQVNLAGQAFYRGESTRAADLLESVARIEQDEVDLRGFEWYHLHNSIQSGLQKTLHHPHQEVSSLHFSSDGGKLLIAGGGPKSGFWRLYDLINDKNIFDDLSLPTTVNGCSFSPDGKQIVLGHGTGKLTILDATTGTAVHRFDTGVSFRSLSWSPDGKLIAGGGERSELFFLNVPMLEQKKITVHGGPVIEVFFSADGLRLYSSASWGTEGNACRLWDCSQWPPTETKHYKGYFITDESPDERSLVGVTLGTIQVIDAKSGSERLSKEIAVGPMLSARYSADGASIYVAARTDRTVRQIDSTTLETISSNPQNFSLTGLCLEKNGILWAAGDARGDVQIWQTRTTPFQFDVAAQTAEHVFVSPGMQDPVIGGRGEACTWSWKNNTFQPWRGLTGLRALSGDSSVAVCVRSKGGYRALVHRQNFEEPFEIKLTAPIYASCAAVSKSGRLLALRSLGHEIVVYDLLPKVPQVIYRLNGQCHQLQFSPDEKYLVGSLQYGAVCAFNMQDGSKRSNYAEFDAWWSWAMGIAFSQDGFYLAVGNESGTVRVWETESQKLVATMTGQPGEIRCVAFLPDGRRLVTGGASDVRIWDFQCSQELIGLPAGGSVESLAIKPSGDTIFAVIRGGRMRAWSY